MLNRFASSVPSGTLIRFRDRLRTSTSAMAHDERGAVAAAMGVAMVPLALVLGLAIDSGLAYAAKSRLQSAVDAAVLAGSQGFANDSASAAADARMFFDANYPNDYLSGHLVSFETGFDDATRAVTVYAEATIPTSFMRIAGQDEVTVSAAATAEPSIVDLELAMVLDVTGSMNWTDSAGDVKIDSLKTASTTLLDTLFGEEETVDQVAVSITPYNMFVNVGSDRTDWLTGFDPAAYGAEGWAGCVEARAGDLDRSDDATTPFQAVLNPTPNPSDGINSRCPESEILPLTSNRATLQDHIDDLEADYGTMTNVGLTWGWRTISENWQGTWDGDVEPADYDDADTVKAIVFMTDGVADWAPGWYSAYGHLAEGRLGTTNETQAEQEIDDRLLESCTVAKGDGIEIYTVMFALDSAPPSVEATYRACATSDAHFFDAATGTELEAAFSQIAGRLTSLRLTQ